MQLMTILTWILALFVSIMHFFFLYLEMFAWTKPLGLKIFRMSLEDANSKKVLAQNQGLYNGFLAFGILWGLFNFNSSIGVHFLIFFEACVIFAGLYGAKTVSFRIFYIQALPAIFALISLLFMNKGMSF